MKKLKSSVSIVAMTLVSIVGANAQEINALVWCDHTDPAFLEPFTEATGIKVNIREYEGTGTALALLEQSNPGDWDVFVVDTTDVKRVVERGLLAPLDPAEEGQDIVIAPAGIAHLRPAIEIPREAAHEDHLVVVPPAERCLDVLVEAVEWS